MLVAHINHGIRKNAILDEEYVKERCEELKIPLYIKREDVLKVAKRDKISVEEAGRNVRYNFFEEILEKTNSNKIAIAQNSNDNAETVLLNIFRGSGISGLKGTMPIRDKKYIRPLIDISRGEIEQYCQEHKLNPRHDESNDESIYTRNKIRNELIPEIQKNFNPNIISTINRLSSLAHDEDRYLAEIVGIEFDRICVGNDLPDDLKCRGRHSLQNTIQLNLKQFNNLHIVIKRRLILYTINKLIGNTTGIEKIHVDDIIKLCENNIGNKYLTPRKHIKVSIYKGIAKFEKLC